jgi:hypothetical protein
MKYLIIVISLIIPIEVFSQSDTAISQLPTIRQLSNFHVPVKFTSENWIIGTATLSGDSTELTISGITTSDYVFVSYLNNPLPNEVLSICQAAIFTDGKLSLYGFQSSKVVYLIWRN